MKKALIIAVLLWALPMLAQSTSGELRLTITDPTGSGLKSTVELVSQSNDYRNTFTTDDQGNLDAKRLPYGIYRAQIRAQGFAEVSESVEIRSALPLDLTVRLAILDGDGFAIRPDGVAGQLDDFPSGNVNSAGFDSMLLRWKREEP
jgi:hypothetical protein